MRSDDFVEPRGFWGLVFGSEDFYYVAMLELFVEVGHFAVDFYADDMTTDF